MAVSANIMKLLTEREWVRVVGHRDVPGRPAVYATTRQFLDYFNLCSLSELPSLSELRDIDDINLDLFGNPMAAMGNATAHTGEPAPIEAAEQDYAEDDADTDEAAGPEAGAGKYLVESFAGFHIAGSSPEPWRAHDAHARPPIGSAGGCAAVA